MNEDSQRERLEFALYCSKHVNTRINISTNSRVGFSSAMEANIKIIVHPCEVCEHEVNKIKNAVKLLTTLD